MPKLSPRLVLLGPRGSGKTTVARLLADRLASPFVDLDELLVETAGRTIAEIFADEGEAGFRDRETAALLDAVSRDCVLATGGGVICRPSNREVLRGLLCPRVFLVASPAVLHERIAGDAATAANRPALTRFSGVDEVAHLLAERLPLYREVATHELDAALPPQELATKLAELL